MSLDARDRKGSAGLLYWVNAGGEMRTRWVPPATFDREAKRHQPLPRRVFRNARPFRTFADMQTLSSAERKQAKAQRESVHRSYLNSLENKQAAYSKRYAKKKREERRREREERAAMLAKQPPVVEGFHYEVLTFGEAEMWRPWLEERGQTLQSVVWVRERGRLVPDWDGR